MNLRCSFFVAASGTLVFAAALAGFAAQAQTRPVAATGSAVRSEAASFASKWSFGIIPDTQWMISYDPIDNPNYIPVSIIRQINPRFIAAGVDFVIQVGDLTDHGNPEDLAVRDAANGTLYDAGIGFFPLRGGHEGTQTGAIAFTNLWPQTQGRGSRVLNAVNFTSPFASLQGLSYAFDYNNVHFVMLDQFQRLDGSFAVCDDAVLDQIAWVGSSLSNRPAGSHALVLSHKDLMGEFHTDMLFGPSPLSNADAQNQFFDILKSSGARYYICGHDHIHQRSLVASPDLLNSVEELICGSASSKFYTPLAVDDPGWDGQKDRETPLAQDLYRITYYIVTVDGPGLTIDYYASDETFPSGYSPVTTPTLHFSRRETFGYSLNGQSFLIPQGWPYTNVQSAIPAGNGFTGTSAAILGGINNSAAKEGAQSLRPLVREVTTGWAPPANSLSDALTLQGMADIGATQTDTYVLSMSCDTAKAGVLTFLASRAANGQWINAVDANSGGIKSYINGPWNVSYGLGTYGIDSAAHNVWAVINHGGSFAAVDDQPSLQISSPDAQGNVQVTWPMGALPLGWSLQFNPGLGATNWVTVSSNGFFRLVKP